ncbi:MAG: hypothetical protein ACT4QD_04640 [Acidobacteriota bacterium]
MQPRRFRPGDVLDDYCPRERRITDHAIVAMIEDTVKQTRCVVCDAEHEYKEGKLPPQRRRKAQNALFAQVLDGLQGPGRTARAGIGADEQADDEMAAAVLPSLPPRVEPSAEGMNGEPVGASRKMASVTQEPAPTEDVLATLPVQPEPSDAASMPAATAEEGPFRRTLIRATLPRPEGQPVVTRAMPEFTSHQPNAGRGAHRGGRRRGGHGHGASGQTRFGRDGQGQDAGQGQGPRQPGSRPQGQHRGRPGRFRRGKKR